MSTFEHLRRSHAAAIDPLFTALASGKLHHATLLLSRSERAALAVATALIEAIVCRATRPGSEGCRACASCKKLAAGNHPDVQRLAPDDKGKIRIDAVREATARLALKPTDSERNVVLIEQADAMNAAAQSALLKTLEEPPGRSCFVLTTARPRALLPTIRSRCQTVRLRPPRGADAWRAVAQAQPDLAPIAAQFLAALADNEPELAAQLREQGADEVAMLLADCLSAVPGAQEQGIAGGALLRLTEDLGSNRERALLGGALLEVALRDAVARARGATPDQLLVPDLRLAPLTPACVVDAAQRLQRWRRAQSCNPHPRLALDNILMSLRMRSPTTAAHSKGMQPAGGRL